MLFFRERTPLRDMRARLSLVAFSHADGDIDYKIETMIENGVEVVHLSSCMRGKAENYENLDWRLGEYFDVVGYTHGSEEGKARNIINIARGKKIETY
jgi:hypothetical protein